jgi:ribonucleoside-diphosphate reductase alpha chain
LRSRRVAPASSFLRSSYSHWNAAGFGVNNSSLKNDPGDDVRTDEMDVPGTKPIPQGAHTTAELFEEITGTSVDAPLCLTCGTKMRPSGSCYVCEGCGSTSGCS